MNKEEIEKMVKFKYVRVISADWGMGEELTHKLYKGDEL